MQRCHQCDSPMTLEEKQCFLCGAPVPDKNAKKPFSERFRLIVNGLFLLSLVTTVGSIMAPAYSPSLWKTFPGLVILYLVRNSAENMAASSMTGSPTQTQQKKS